MENIIGLEKDLERVQEVQESLRKAINNHHVILLELKNRIEKIDLKFEVQGKDITFLMEYLRIASQKC